MLRKSAKEAVNNLLRSLFFPLLLVVSYAIQESHRSPDETSDVPWAVLIAIVLALIALTSRRSPFRALGVTTEKITARMLLSLLPLMVVSNACLFAMQKWIEGVDFYCSIANSRELWSAIFKGNVRTFGEELVFRGWLFLPGIRGRSTAFWIMNSVQSVAFALVHASIPNPPAFQITLSIFAFALAFLYGWLNRRFNSLVPSWTLHASNGLYHMIVGPR